MKIIIPMAGEGSRFSQADYRLYNKKEYTDLINNPSVDCIVWTFTKRESLRKNPTSRGGINLGDA